ncbi:MAG: CHAT domain-containing protein [Saprospiraceae bacterium]|nr:CHAT domain-containing protein [Candidatus Vicinibacter affinis]
MKKCLYILFFLSISNFILGQTVDSIAIKHLDSLIKVSREFAVKKDYSQGIAVIGSAEQYTIEKFGRESSQFASCLLIRGLNYFYMADFKETEKVFLEAKAIYEQVLGKESLKYASSLDFLAFLYRRLNNFEKAEAYWLESISIQEKLQTTDLGTYITSLSNLAFLYNSNNNYEKAEIFFLKLLAAREKLFGKNHQEYAKSLKNLGGLYQAMGDYKKAESYFLEGIAIEAKVLGKEHPTYANSLTGLAIVYFYLGNYTKAESLYLEGIHIMKNVSGKQDIFLANSLKNLANLYCKTQSFDKAEPLHIEAKEIIEKVKGKEGPDYANSLEALANLYVSAGKYEKAEQALIESIAILDEAIAKKNYFYSGNVNMLSLYANSMKILADLYLKTGSLAKAEPLLIKSKSIEEKVKGKDHPDYTITSIYLSNLYEAQNRFDMSESLLTEVQGLSQKRLINSTSFLSELELAEYVISSQEIGNDLFGKLTARNINGSELGILPSLAFDQSLFYKGFVLNAAERLNLPSLIQPESAELAGNLKSYRRQLAAEYAKPLDQRNDISELEAKANSAEKELARSAKGYADASRQVKWQDVKAVLKPSEAAIEFVHFKFSFQEKSDSTMYAALLFISGDKQPKFIPLFEEKSLDSLLNSKSERKADYVNSLYTLVDRGAVAVEAHKKSLYEILWKPLEKELTHVNTIYFSPSGLLHRLNLDAIPFSETETLADRYNLIELNSTRQLVIPTQIKNANNDAVLYGGIQYEQDSMFQSNEPLMASRSRGELSFSNVDTTLRGGSWNYLAGTEREVNAIEKIMQTSGVQTNLKKGYAATEDSFKNIGVDNSPSPRILHIATHGYFFNDPKNTAEKSKVGSQAESVFKMSDHPMLRSGLIMSGGNVAWQGKPTLEGREDGVLTAYEISQMNLSNTELVVLSACETGLGDIQGNEGVYGLQRAFKIAGAKHIIMSLWQVPDKQTSLLMTTFYKKWLENKMTIPDAFHAAQKELRDIGLDPYQWAGFVLVE